MNMPVKKDTANTMKVKTILLIDFSPIETPATRLPLTSWSFYPDASDGIFVQNTDGKFCGRVMLSDKHRPVVSVIFSHWHGNQESEDTKQCRDKQRKRKPQTYYG